MTEHRCSPNASKITWTSNGF